MYGSNTYFLLWVCHLGLSVSHARSVLRSQPLVMSIAIIVSPASSKYMPFLVFPFEFSLFNRCYVCGMAAKVPAPMAICPESYSRRPRGCNSGRSTWSDWTNGHGTTSNSFPIHWQPPRCLSPTPCQQSSDHRMLKLELRTINELANNLVLSSAPPCNGAQHPLHHVPFDSVSRNFL